MLRKVAGRYLKPGTLGLPKKGFGLPLHGWLPAQDTGELEAGFLDPSSRLVELFSPAYLRGLVHARRQNGESGSRLWTLAVLGEWFRQHPSASLSVN